MPRGSSVIPNKQAAITNAPAISSTPASRYAAQTMRALAEEVDRVRRERIQPVVDQQARDEAASDVENQDVREVPQSTRYGQMYQQSAEIALTTKVERDAREEAERLYRTVGGDVEAFKAQFEEWTSSTAGQYPPGMARTVLNASDAAGRGVVESMLNENFKQQQKEAIEGIRTKQQEARDQVLIATRDGDMDGLRVAMQEYTDATSVRAGFHGEVYSDDMAAVDLEDLQFDVLVTASVPEVDAAFEENGVLGARLMIQGLVDAENGLTPAQATTYKSRLDERINNLLMIANEVEAQEAAKTRAEDAAIEDMREIAQIEATTLYAQGKLGSEWLLENSKRLGPAKYESWTKTLMSDAESAEGGGASSAQAYVDFVFGTLDGDPSSNLSQAAEAYVNGSIDKTMFNNIRTLDAAAADDRVRSATQWVKAQFRSEGGFAALLDMNPADAQAAADVVRRVATWATENPDATREDVMTHAMREVADAGRGTKLKRSLDPLPGPNTEPRSQSDLDLYKDWLAEFGDTQLSEDQLIEAFRSVDRWEIYLGAEQTADVPVGGQ